MHPHITHAEDNDHALPKEGISSDMRHMHYSAGALIARDGKYLLLDRTNPPYGFAGAAGHVDVGELPEVAVIREVREETGLTVVSAELLFSEEVKGNSCRAGIDVHHWYLYACETKGEIIRAEKEAKELGWFTIEQIRTMTFEPVWKHWFTKLDLL
ncbi:MAG TPA: NUDIX domain-containing protein [Candidatus Paceibacterota bacterium]